MGVRKHLVRRERPPIVRLGRVMLPADVRDDPEVLLHPREDRRLLARQRLRLEEGALRRREVPGLQLDSAQRN